MGGPTFVTNKHRLTTLFKVPSHSMSLSYLVAREGINNTKNESRKTNREGRDDEKSEEKFSLASMQTNKWWRRSRREGIFNPSTPLASSSSAHLIQGSYWLAIR